MSKMIPVDLNIRVDLLTDCWEQHFDRLKALDRLVEDNPLNEEPLRMYLRNAEKIAGLFVQDELVGYALVEDLEVHICLALGPSRNFVKHTR